MSKDSTLSRCALRRYAVLALPLAFAGMPLYIHAPDYYATHMGMSLGSLGVVLLCLRLLDAIQDPLIGRLSDRYRMYRLPVMIVAAFVLVLSFIALFHPYRPTYAMVWFAVCIFLATTAFSVISINLNTLGGLWSHETVQKTRITSTREICGLLGLLLAVVLPSVLMQSMSASSAFWVVGAILALLMLGAMWLFHSWYMQHAMTQPTAQKPSLSIGKVLYLLPKPTKTFLGIYALSMIASSIPAVLVLFFIRDRLGAEAYAGLFLALYFMFAAAAMPLWQYVANRKGRVITWMLSMALAVVSFIWAYFLEAGDIMPYALICIMSGMAFGADLSLPPAILAEHIHASGHEADAGAQFALLTFLAKGALAVASCVALPLIEQVGFVPESANSARALWGVSVVYAVIPCAIKLATIGLLWRAAPSIRLGEYYENFSTNNRSTHHA